MIKKILLTVVISIITFTAHAEYNIHVPLEASQGGSLPTGSINISNSGSINPPEPVEERCQYEYNVDLSLSTTWAYRSAGARTSLIWNKEVLVLQSANMPDEIIINGYKYSKGELQTQTGSYTLYKICRDKL